MKKNCFIKQSIQYMYHQFTFCNQIAGNLLSIFYTGDCEDLLEDYIL